MTFKARFAGAALALAATPLLATPPALASPCGASTAASQAYADSPSDSESGLSPEITGATASLNSSCGLSLSYAIPDTDLIQGESLSWYLNTDGNALTGDGVFEGAEYVVMTLGRTGQDDPPRLMAWNGTTFDVAGAKTLANAGPFGFTATIADLNGLASGGALSFVGAAGYRGIYDNYYDWAPDITVNGQEPAFSFPLTFTAVAPAPTTAPPATTTPQPEAPATSATGAAACKVPLLKGLTVKQARKRLRGAGCSIGRINLRNSKSLRGKIIASTPRRGTSLAAGAKVALIVGRTPKARSAQASSFVAAALARDHAAAADRD